MAVYPNQGNRNVASGPAQTNRTPATGYMPLRQAMDRLLQDSFLGPSVFGDVWNWPGATNEGWNAAALSGTNLWESKEGYHLQISMPGVSTESIDCSVEQNILTCKAQPANLAPPNATPLWQGIGAQSAYRVQLPGDVESGQAQASYENGILTIYLPKAAHARSHSIKVTAK